MRDIHSYDFDFCVVGGGLAGMCAAISAARHGAKTAIIQERPMFGGNASSEIRMWICGAGGKNTRETGILEEIALENLYRNPYKLWPVWDGILYEKLAFEPNLTVFLNCSCFDAEMNGSRIASILCWQMTTQRLVRIAAKNFADCSGDSVLAPLTGAWFRVGREAAGEFGERVSVTEADRKTMGMSCLIQARKLDRPVKFTAPEWAKRLTADDMKNRRPNLESSSENFWYLELGGDRDSIGDTEKVRDELLALAYGFWDYVKNSGEFDAELWQLDFLGFLPGKRESRRMVGAYIMTQNDVVSGGRFDDVVAYGGWPLDDHDPRGFWHEGRPCEQIPTPSPFGIPYRCLYSANVENLFFAGRNISMTHAAMSSARVMATCALLGQAVGTAAAIANRESITPDGVYAAFIDELKATLMDDDIMLPYNTRVVPEISRGAALSGSVKNLNALRDGFDRDNAVRFADGDYAEYILPAPTYVKSARIVFDSDLDRSTLPGDDCERRHMTRCNVKPDSPVMELPKTLAESCTVTAILANGKEETLARVNQNRRRLVVIDINAEVKSIRLTVNKGRREKSGVFSFEIR